MSRRRATGQVMLGSADASAVGRRPPVGRSALVGLAATAVLATALVMIPVVPAAAVDPPICATANPTLKNGSFEVPAVPNDGANQVPATDQIGRAHV